jgi:hypothetical protein
MTSFICFNVPLGGTLRLTLSADNITATVFFFFLTVVLDRGTLWHLQKFLT